MERGIELFNTDKPINDTKSDLLNRASFAKQLASAILSYTNTDQSVFAENGDLVKPQFSI